MPDPMMYNSADDLHQPLLSPSSHDSTTTITHNTNYHGLGRRQLYALTKMNLLIRYRTPFVTLTELLSPLLVISLIVIGYSYSLQHIRHTDTYIFTDSQRMVNAIATFKSGLLPNIPEWTPTRETTHCAVLPMAPAWQFCFDTETNRDMLYAITGYNGPTPVPTLKQFVAVSRAFSKQFGDITDDAVKQRINQLNTLVDGQFQNLLFLGELWFVTGTTTNSSSCAQLPCSDVVSDGQVEQFVQYMRETVDGFQDVTIQLFDTEQHAIAALSTLNDTQYVWAVINFHTFEPNSEIDYSIRMNHSVVPDTYTMHDRFNVGLDGSYKLYVYSGFLTLQYTIDTALYNYTSDAAVFDVDPYTSRMDIVSPNNVTITPFPIPSYRYNRFYERMQVFMGLLLSMCFLIPVSLFVKALVDDKESRMKEVMRVMSMIDYAYTLSYFIATSVIFIASAILCTTVLHATFFSHISYTVLLVFMSLNALTLVNFCFLLSTFFNKGKIAAILTPIVMLMLTLPRYAYYNGSDSSAGGHTVGMTLVSVLFSPTGFIFGCDMFMRYESASINLQWSNVFADEYSMGRVLIIQSINFVLYGVIAWYCENVLPNEYGSNLPPWFMFTPWYWKAPQVVDDTDSVIDEAESPNQRVRRDTLNDSNNVNIEVVSDSMADRARLKIRHLRKVFSSGIGRYKKQLVAVHGLDLTLYGGQITSLLGQNGAGKTTTISMLTGLMQTTSGVFTMGQYNNQQHMKYMRRSIGMCAQQNTLYPALTVYEQLSLFATLKNVPSSQLHDTVTRIIDEVGLTAKSDAYTSTLSGGQQRKVCVACAFIGGSTVVFLDEPTTGMDPLSRRSTWDVLKQYKHGRVILLTTHFLDEADLLSDRIAVMTNGRLQCCGSSLFLKSRYGIGYNLTLVKSSRKCNVDAVSDLIYRHVSDAELLSCTAGELAYQLPLLAVPLFAGLLTELEQKRGKLHVGAYGIAMTSLEEVFLRIVDDNETLLSPETRSRTTSSASASSVQPTPLKKRQQQQLLGDDDLFDTLTSKSSSATRYNTYWAQFVTLWHKRYLVAVRDPIGRFVELLVPLITVVVVLLVFNMSRKSSGIKLQLSSAMYTGVGIDYTEKPTLLVNTNAQSLEPSAMDYVQHSPNYQVNYVDYASCVNVSQYLLDTAFVNNDDRYGAIVMNDSFMLDFKHSPVPFGPRVKEYVLEFPLNLMHNSSFYHAVPVLLNEVNAARYNALHGRDDIKYTVNSHPLPATTQPTIKQQTFLSLLTAAFILIPFCYIPASYVVFVVHERVNKVKHMQLMCGVNTAVYWLVIYMFDLLNYLFVSINILLILLMFNNNLYVKTWTNVMATASVLSLYGTAVIPLSYCYSALFHTNTSAQIGIMSLHFLFGFVLTIVSFMFDLIESLQPINGTMKLLYRVFPAYNLGEALINISINELKNSYGNTNVPVWSTHVIGTNIVCLVVQSLVYMAIPFALEMQTTRRVLLKCVDMFISCIRRQPAELFELIDDQDDDVEAERMLIESGHTHVSSEDSVSKLSSLLVPTPNNQLSSADVFECKVDTLDLPPTSPPILLQRSISVEPDNTVAINQLRKVYHARDGQPIVAVQSLSLGIRRGECFGLLGVNGAGKTTTMKMLTGDILPTGGDANLNRHSIRKDIDAARAECGYTPQHDPLIDCMTAREQLHMYARFRGTIQPRSIPRYVDHMLQRLKLDRFANALAGTYSGGNKRKLSLAIALIGQPSVVMLDEPSSGMDPVSRRFMWTVISSLSDVNKSCILTSHSMSETEALCQRIGIMISGRLRCIGTIQHLKNKFGRGYNIEFNTDEQYVSGIKQFVSQQFPTAELDESHCGRLIYTLPKVGTSLAGVFAAIEVNKQVLHVDDYSVSQSTLEAGVPLTSNRTSTVVIHHCQT